MGGHDARDEPNAGSDKFLRLKRVVQDSPVQAVISDPPGPRRERILLL